jgi:hypothetical protein
MSCTHIAGCATSCIGERLPLPAGRRGGGRNTGKFEDVEFLFTATIACEALCRERHVMHLEKIQYERHLDVNTKGRGESSDPSGNRRERNSKTGLYIQPGYIDINFPNAGR